MNRKKIWLDPSFWLLVVINGYLVYHYYQHPEIFNTLLWLYWSQSLLLGIFNALDMLTVRKVKLESVIVNGVRERTYFTDRISSSLFFMFHYGCFHLVYFVFLRSMTKNAAPVQWNFFKYFFYAFLASQIISFIQHKIQQRKQPSSLGTMFMIPYIRIIPMHLTILIPSFLPISSMGIFLVLKSLADVGMYVVTKPSYGDGRQADAAVLAAQQRMDINI